MIAPRVRAGLVLLFVFTAGGVAGMAVERHHSIQLHGALSAADEHEAALTDLRQALDLDERQTEQIHAIMAERQQIVQSMWEQLRPEVQSAMRDVHTEIAALLRPDQQARFHDWILERRDQSLPH